MIDNIDTVTVYLEDIGRYPLLESEEEVNLAKKMCEGDLDAHNKLIESNLRLVAKIASRYMSAYGSKNLDYLDMIQEGNLGLIHAVEKFDYTKGYKFSTFATYWIKSYIKRSIVQKEENIRLPDDVYDLYSKFKKTNNELYSTLRREPRLEEIAEKMQIDLKKVKELECMHLKTRSLHEIIEDTETEFGSLLVSNEPTPEEMFLKKEKYKLVRDMLDECLTDREIKILLLRLGFITGEPVILEEIGAYLGICYQRVSAIYQSALKKIRVQNKIQIYQLNRTKK